ncbi:DUF6507 family protein [Pseudactinotalea sp.]|uniref:DUF6507 family protein n=1 Tax=Pseudactinotalea sp. TaxID=1926260 RepID=UPI003B3A3FEB
MSKWNIDPGGVQQILTAVNTDSGDLGKALKDEKFTAIFEGLTWGGGVTMDVPSAVQGLLEDQTSRLSNISNRINAASVGVANATIAYNNGQQDMAATFQAKAIEAATSGDFTYFVENGYQG